MLEKSRTRSLLLAVIAILALGGASSDGDVTPTKSAT